jgi:hypothetical protein
MSLDCAFKTGAAADYSAAVIIGCMSSEPVGQVEFGNKSELNPSG